MWLKVNQLNSITSKRSLVQFPHYVISPSYMDCLSSFLLLLLLHSFGYICMVSKLFARVICAALTCVFAIVGSMVGAIIGALIGHATESGLLRGSGIGAISGAVFSIEAVESSLDLWNSRECGSWSLRYLMNALSLPFMETLDLYETDGNSKAMSMDEVEKLPKSKVTARTSLDESGEKISCSVCLQDLQVGEMVRRLPVCCHMYHLPCLDSWLIRHGSCPLCRREVV